MKRILLPVLLIAGYLFASTGQAKAWGFWAHQRINRLAVFTLPPDMLVLYKQNLEYVTTHAVDPDKRRYAMDGEAPRHYIDIDHYGTYPFDNMPRNWTAAEEKFSRDTLEAFGIVPWHINSTYYRLVEAFQNGNLERIMKISADIGHYIADSNVPLHTTENYNGQMTNQKGIHGLWESRLPELFGMEYDYYLGRAKYLDNVLDEAWSSVLESHLALDSVLKFEEKLTKKMASDRKYSYENRNNISGKSYSKDFCDAYHEMLDGQVERRIRASIIRVGSIWYTAWIDAGQPDLKKLMNQELEIKEEKYERKLNIIDREKGEIGSVTDSSYEAIFGSCCGHGMNVRHTNALKKEEGNAEIKTEHAHSDDEAKPAPESNHDH